MKDTIYRQDAIEELKKYIAVNKNPNHDARIWEEGMNCAITVIGALPSAQPEPLTVNFAREMDRETIEKLKEGMKNAPVLIMAVNDSAQSEIIRCKDCSRWCICHRSDEWYCADAERRKDG